jgi:RimJ/RimL family protein N-acetyltransferase
MPSENTGPGAPVGAARTADTGPPSLRTLIETRRLVLRVPQPSDLPLLQARVFADSDVMRHVAGGGVLAPERAAAFFATAFDHEGTGRRPGVLVEKATGEILGYAGPMACRALGKDDIEIGFVLARLAWGKGYGAEIGRGQLEYAFGALGCARVLALAAAGNVASIATLARLGMQFHGIVNLPERGLRNVYVAPRG